MQTSSGFLVVPSEGQLSPGESLQCTITFCPESSGVVEGELELCYESGRITATRLVGRGHEVDVEVSTQEVQLLPTYMNKVSQKTFKIYNRSDTVVRFSFRQYATEVMDAEATTNKISRLYETQQSATGDQRALPEAMLGRDSDFVPRNYGARCGGPDHATTCGCTFAAIKSTARCLSRASSKSTSPDSSQFRRGGQDPLVAAGQHRPHPQAPAPGDAHGEAPLPGRGANRCSSILVFSNALSSAVQSRSLRTAHAPHLAGLSASVPTQSTTLSPRNARSSSASRPWRARYGPGARWR